MDVTKMRRKAEKLAAIRATLFKPEIEGFTRKSLAKACRNTPVRPLDDIRFNQIEKPNSQYNQWRSHGGQGIEKRDWLAARAPARFLYQLSWYQVATSINLSFPVSANILAATTRNDEEPDRGYAQWRGGNHKLSVAIYNPFLETPQRKYKDFMGSEILKEATDSNRPVFLRAVERKFKRATYAIMHSDN